nr:MAG TPA: hypothetical protein [Caudoviricetes sp.]
MNSFIRYTNIPYTLFLLFNHRFLIAVCVYFNLKGD